MQLGRDAELWGTEFPGKATRLIAIASHPGFGDRKVDIEG
jgi:hypothetical protein